MKYLIIVALLIAGCGPSPCVYHCNGNATYDEQCARGIPGYTYTTDLYCDPCTIASSSDERDLCKSYPTSK